MSDKRVILSVELSPGEMAAFDAARGARSRSDVVRDMIAAYAGQPLSPAPVPQPAREEPRTRRFRRMRSALSSRPARQTTPLMRDSTASTAPGTSMSSPVPGKPSKPSRPSRRFAHEEIAASSGDMDVMVMEDDGTWSYVTPPERRTHRDSHTGAFGENQPSDIKRGGEPPAPKVGERWDVPIDDVVVQVQHDPDHHLSRDRSSHGAGAPFLNEFKHSLNIALGRE